MSDSSLLEKCCSIGQTISGDPSHFMIVRAIKALGLDWRFLSFEIAEDRLADALTGVDVLGLRGVRLLGDFCHQGKATLHKTERASRTGRITHLTRHEETLLGDDATGPALIEALLTQLGDAGDPAGKKVVLLGAGNAAPSVADVLIERGVQSLTIADTNSERAAALVLSLRSRPVSLTDTDPQALKTRLTTDKQEIDTQIDPQIEPLPWESNWIDLPQDADWIISTASWPKEENQAIAQLIGPELQADQLLVDMGIGSNRSPLLLAAEQQGLQVLEGLPILVAETALALEAWSGEAVDRVALFDAAEEFLGV